ncbi:P-loop NTPase family protein [Zavarzinella formosa]|uniref:hypothetical protein n=1 Tax=Zavarzinella formosa TaxID=360055 RepID=UPI0002F5787E|nr:hypothetical protein [Zavarzinella formosa]
MGRTYEVLSGNRLRKASGAESLRSIPFPGTDPEPLTIQETEETSPVNLVPMTEEDLPSDDNSIPFVEVGDKNTPTAGQATQPTGPRLLSPREIPEFTTHQVGFQLLREVHIAPVSPQDLPAKFVTYHQPNHPVSRQYRGLVDGILRQLPEGGCPVLCFTPSVPGTITATTLINLAITRSTDGEGRILIVELVRGSNSTSTALGLPNQPGLREVLARTTPLTLAVNRTTIDGVFLMPAGKVEIGMDESSRLGGVIDQLRARFDWIIVEAPAWGTFPMKEWMQSSDGVYLITRPEEWDSPQTEFAHQGILDAGGKLRGCVTTRE